MAHALSQNPEATPQELQIATVNLQSDTVVKLVGHVFLFLLNCLFIDCVLSIRVG